MQSKSEWNQKLRNFKNANITQLWEQGEIAKIYARGNPEIIRIADENGMLQAIKYKHDTIPLFSFIVIGGIGGGPCFNDIKALKEMISDLPFAFRTHLYFPETIYGEITLNLPRFKREIVYSWVIDLTTPENIWRSQFDNKQRNMVRKALKKGVIIRSADKEDLEEWINIKMDTQKRIGQKVTGKEGESAKYMFKNCKGWAELLVAKLEDKVVSGFWLTKFNDIAYYGSPASTGEAFKTGANNLLVWEALRKCCIEEKKLFDFWGIVKDKNDPTYSVTRFKKSFGGRVVKVYHYWKNF